MVSTSKISMLSAKSIVQAVKSITAKEFFCLHPEVKQQLWVGNFWTAGYSVNTVGQYANESVVMRDIKIRGGETATYKTLHKNQFSLEF